MLNRSALVAVALVVGLAGGSVASATGLINGRSIVNHTITTDKLTKAAVKSLSGQRGKRGARGATGAAGAPGTAGAPGAAGSVSGVAVIQGAYSGATYGVGQTITATASCGEDTRSYGKMLVGGGAKVTTTGTMRAALVSSYPSTPSAPGVATGINGVWTATAIVTAAGNGTDMVTIQPYAICA